MPAGLRRWDIVFYSAVGSRGEGAGERRGQFGIGKRDKHPRRAAWNNEEGGASRRLWRKRATSFRGLNGCCAGKRYGAKMPRAAALRREAENNSRRQSSRELMRHAN